MRSTRRGCPRSRRSWVPRRSRPTRSLPRTPGSTRRGWARPGRRAWCAACRRRRPSRRVGGARMRAEPRPERRVDGLEPEAREAAAVVFGAGVVPAGVAAGLAARVGSGITCETTDFTLDDGGPVAVRPGLGDTVMVESTFASSPGIILGRANAFASEPTGSGTAPVERVAVTVQDWSSAARMAGREQAETGGVDITEADVLVAFGRGIGGPENIPVVEQLARALGGEVAATRAVVDAGWTSYSMQVGQTGKTVSPKLYVACGISGAIQHKVGMANAGVIVAINKDVNAPIFEFADLGVVGDALTVVPKLTDALKAR